MMDDKPAPPSLPAMAGSLISAVVEHAIDVVKRGGKAEAPPEVQAQRKATCYACPLHDHERDRCMKCGCVAMDVKRFWSSSVCPDTPPRWEAV